MVAEAPTINTDLTGLVVGVPAMWQLLERTWGR
jgi:hypothetical protein